MDWLNEVVGFIIVLFVLLFPLLRKLLVDLKKQQKASQQEEEEEVPPFQPQRVQPGKSYAQPPKTSGLVRRDFDFQASLEERTFDSEIADRQLESKVNPKFKKRIVSQAFILEKLQRGEKVDPLSALVHQRKSTQAMVILSEIMGGPKGLQ